MVYSRLQLTVERDEYLRNHIIYGVPPLKVYARDVVMFQRIIAEKLRSIKPPSVTRYATSNNATSELKRVRHVTSSSIR